jgi:type II secretory pathway pseudopilin PulG
MLKKERGFGLVGVMAVVAVIGLLAGIGIPGFLKFRREAADSSAEGDAKNAYKATQSYFFDYPTRSLSAIEELTAYGFKQTSDVNVSVSGNERTLEIIAYHDSGDKTFTVDRKGTICE